MMLLQWPRSFKMCLKLGKVNYLVNIGEGQEPGPIRESINLIVLPYNL